MSGPGLFSVGGGRVVKFSQGKLYWDGSGEHDVLFTNATESTQNPDFTVNGVKGEFSTLSGLEWKYLLAQHKQKSVSITGKSGIALIPDGYKGSLADTYDASAWAAADIGRPRYGPT